MSKSGSFARRMLIGVTAAVACVAVVGTVVPAANAATTKPVTRLAGTDRVGTAVAISQNTFPADQSAKAVVLTASYDFPDAMSGGPLAAQLGGPVLLTTPGLLSPATLTEVNRVLPPGSTVYILGGYAAIASTIDSALTSAGFVPKRIAGPNRFATSVAIAQAEGSPRTVLLATGNIFADALSAGPAAASVHGAVLLTDGPNVPPSVVAYLANLPNPTVYAIGAAAAKADPSATAYFGGDRFATSALVAQKFFTSPTVVGVATGWDFPDALAGAAAMGSKGGPVLLSDPKLLPSADALYLTDNQSTIQQAYLFGGPAALSQAIYQTVYNQINNNP